MTLTFRYLAALALLASSAATRAAPTDDPVAVVRAFYTRDSIRAYEFYSARLKALFVEDDRQADGDIGNLDFAFYINAQDTEDGWERTLRIDLVKRTARNAEVRATFKNFQPQDIRYALVRQQGRWLIDDVRSVIGRRWVLSEIFGRPLGTGAPIQQPDASSASSTSPMCTQEADAPVSRISTSWDALYAHFKRFGHCDDGAVYEGFSQAVLTLLDGSWDQVPRLADLARRDDAFRMFVLRHVDDMSSSDTLRRVRDLSQKSCPRDCAQLCGEIAAAADRVLGKQAPQR